MESYLENIIQQYGYDVKIMYEPFYLELNPNQEAVKFPTLFNKHHSSQIHPKVMLCDPAGNMFQIAVEVRYGEAYFIQGWTNVSTFYGLHQGGWAKLVFVAPDMFLVTLTDHLDRPVPYPLPANICLLNQPHRVVPYPRNDLVASHYSKICKKPDFFHTLEFELTHADVTYGFLHIPLEFCRVAFRQSGSQMLLYDEYGLQTSCVVDFNINHPTLCGITEGWHQFCSAKWYYEGLRVQLGVPVSNPHLISMIALDV